MQTQRIECPVTALTEYREGLYCWISDASKDVYGFRMRYDIDLYDNAELLSLADEWQQRVDEALAEEVEKQAKDVISFESLVNQTIDSGAGNRKTAIRWLLEADDSYCTEDAFLYRHGLSHNYDIYKGCTKVRNKEAEMAV